jgi:hypothetical protein
MGSSLNTSRQKPFTIIETASSSEMPRWRSSPILEVEASCSTCAVEFFTSM